MSTPLLALAFHLAGINPATPTEKEFLEEVSKFVELSQNLGAIRTYSDEERAEIHTWIAFSQKISQEDMQKLDSLLVKRSFLVGNRITAADILTFAAIHDQKLVESVLQLAHVARWFDHVQHSVYPNVVPVTPITHRAFVFPWLESSSSTPAPVAATETKPPAAPENKKADAPKKEEKVENKKADKKEKAEKAEKPAEKKKEEAPKAATEAKPEEAKPLSADGLDPSKLEIRVGQIVKCWNHPESDKLLCEEIDLNEGSIRTIASGLRNFYTAEQMQGRKVLVLANLKERPMAGFKSQGMVLCAIGEGHSVVKLLEPPASANVGDRVDIAGFVGEPTPATQVAKKKIFESLAPFFRTNADGLPTWNNIPFTIKGENCVATLPNAVVS